LLYIAMCFNRISKSTSHASPSQQGGIAVVTKADGPVARAKPAMATFASFLPLPVGSAQAQPSTANAASTPLSLQPHVVPVENSPVQQGRKLPATAHPQSPKTRERSIERSPVQQGRKLPAMHPQSPKTRERLVAEHSRDTSIECSPVQQSRKLPAVTHPQSPKIRERVFEERSLSTSSTRSTLDGVETFGISKMFEVISVTSSRFDERCSNFEASVVQINSAVRSMRQDIDVLQSRLLDLSHVLVPREAPESDLISEQLKENNKLQALYEELRAELLGLRSQHETQAQLARDVEAIHSRHFDMCTEITKQKEQHGLLFSLHKESHNNLQAQHQELCGQIAELRNQQNMHSKLVHDVKEVHGRHLDSVLKQKEQHGHLLNRLEQVRGQQKEEHDHLHALHEELRGQLVELWSKQDLQAQLAREMDATQSRHVVANNAIAKQQEQLDRLCDLHQALRCQLSPLLSAPEAIKHQVDEHNHLCGLHYTLSDQVAELREQHKAQAQLANVMEAMQGHHRKTADTIAKQHGHPYSSHQDLRMQPAPLMSTLPLKPTPEAMKLEKDEQVTLKCSHKQLCSLLIKLRDQQEQHVQLAEEMEALREENVENQLAVLMSASEETEQLKEQYGRLAGLRQQLRDQVAEICNQQDLHNASEAVAKQEEPYDHWRSQLSWFQK